MLRTLSRLFEFVFNREGLYIRAADGSEISVKSRELRDGKSSNLVMMMWSMTVNAPYEENPDESFTSVGDSLTAQDLIDDALDYGDDKDD